MLVTMEGSRVLAMPGSDGWVVMAMRQILRDRGIMASGNRGVYDNGLELAVKAWQSRCGLPATGILDEDTWLSLVGDDDSGLDKAAPPLGWRCLSLASRLVDGARSRAWLDGDDLRVGIIGFHGYRSWLPKVLAGIPDKVVFHWLPESHRITWERLRSWGPPRSRYWGRVLGKDGELVSPWLEKLPELLGTPEGCTAQDRCIADVVWPDVEKAAQAVNCRTERDVAMVCLCQVLGKLPTSEAVDEDRGGDFVYIEDLDSLLTMYGIGDDPVRWGGFLLPSASGTGR